MKFSEVWTEIYHKCLSNRKTLEMARKEVGYHKSLVFGEQNILFYPVSLWVNFMGSQLLYRLSFPFVSSELDVCQLSILFSFLGLGVLLLGVIKCTRL